MRTKQQNLMIRLFGYWNRYCGNLENRYGVCVSEGTQKGLLIDLPEDHAGRGVLGYLLDRIDDLEAEVHALRTIVIKKNEKKENAKKK